MKNNKGFIAISLIYSFFLVFLVVLLSIASNYAKNRILLNQVKNTTEEYLNGLSELKTTYLENRTYTNGDAVQIGYETWEVIKDNGKDVSLILKRSLTNSEIKNGLGHKYENAIDGDKVLMCYTAAVSGICNNVNYAPIYYTWHRSLVKIIVEEWMDEKNLTQKIGNMLEMGYQDTPSAVNNSLIRIPLADEYDAVGKDTSIWYLTRGGESSKTFQIKIGPNLEVTAYSERKAIRPVITVQKATPEPEEKTS